MITGMDGYEDSRVTLMEEAMRNVKFYLKDEAVLYLAAIAQRVSISLKVAATISFISLVFSSRSLLLRFLPVPEKRVSPSQTAILGADDRCRILEGAQSKPGLSGSHHETVPECTSLRYRRGLGLQRPTTCRSVPFLSTSH